MVFCYPALANPYTYLLVYNCLYLRVGVDHLSILSVALLHNRYSNSGTNVSYCMSRHSPIFMICVQVGKEFPDIRQNERREFTGAGDWLLAQRAKVLTGRPGTANW